MAKMGLPVVMAKMPTSATGSNFLSGIGFGTLRVRGFSLVELMVVLAIAAMLMVAAVPSSVRFYEGMQRRQAVRDAVTMLSSARERALSSGRVQDVNVRPLTRRIWYGKKTRTLPEGLSLTVHGAAELNRESIGVIRFYPDGSASGGGIDIARDDGSGTRISVDWLVGRVRQTALTQG
ncbi:Tfp pilus assembly protein FimT/FimU [Congregibacter sp.]|uniref:Tfp pilus assembly protein FimT/FimU n=1 Tax=Congregibacter sp. TaxID=2744308 RepID=UPI0039E509B9